MGIIGDFFRKKVKQEEKKIGKKYHGEYTREELRSKAGESVLRKTILAGGMVVTCAIVGIGIGVSGDSKSTGEPVTDKTTGIETETNDIKGEISTLVNLPEDIMEGYKEDNNSKIDDISKGEDAIKFIKEMYIEEYNKVNGTDYTADDILLYTKPQDYLYNVDGVYMTHGSTPNDVKARLDKENESYEVGEHKNVKLYTAYLKEDDKTIPLESFIDIIGGSDVDVILGDEYKNGKEISLKENNTLLNMSSIIKEGTELSTDIFNGRRESDIILRKNCLKSVVNDYEKQNNNKEIEKDEDVIGG